VGVPTELIVGAAPQAAGSGLVAMMSFWQAMNAVTLKIASKPMSENLFFTIFFIVIVCY
jgi:hypothetical protein